MPPRPGLEWKEETHRWIRPDTGHAWAHSGEPIPASWTDVQTFKDSSSHIIASGVDKNGKRKYLYSAAHKEGKTAAKFMRLKNVDKAMPAIRSATATAGRHDDAAAVLYMISETGFRVGGEGGMTAGKPTYGATTLQAKHVTIKGNSVTFKFTGKKGVPVRQVVKDPVLANLIGTRLQGKEPTDRIFNTGQKQVLQHLRGISSSEFKVHDLRTWNGTKMAERLVNSLPAPVNKKGYEAARKMVGERVAEFLGNTPVVSLSSYIAPETFAPWELDTAPQGSEEMTKAQDDFDVLRDVHYAHAERAPITSDELYKLAHAALTMQGSMILKAEENVESGTADGRIDMTDLPGAPPQDLDEDDQNARDMIEQVQSTLSAVVHDPETARQLDPSERQHLSTIADWLARNEAHPQRAHDDTPRRAGFEQHVKMLSKALDSTLSVKAVIKGPRGTLVLKDAYSEYWDLPGGHVQDGETLEDALKREVKEETGLTLVKFRERGVHMLKLNTLRPVVMYDATASTDVPILSEEHTGYQWARDKDLKQLNLGVFRDFVLNKSELIPSGEEVAVQRPSLEGFKDDVDVTTEFFTESMGDGLTNSRYEAMRKTEFPGAQDNRSDAMGDVSALDNPVPIISTKAAVEKEGDGGGGIAGPGDSTVGSDVHTPVGGSSRKRATDKMRIITRKTYSTLSKAMVGKTYVLRQGDAAQTLAELESNSVHCCVTSPPYWNPNGTGVGLSQEQAPETFADNLTRIFRPLKKSLVSQGSLWLILGNGHADHGKQVPEMVLKVMTEDGWLHQGTYEWHKGTEHADRVFHLTKQHSFYKAPMFALPKVLLHAASERRDGAEFMAFPVELATKVIKATCPMGGVVIDPFVGTGTTVMAAVGNGRRGIGIDISDNELSIAEKRVGLVEMLHGSTKLQKAVDDPEKYNLQLVNKNWTGKAHNERFIVAGYASPVIVDLEGHKISHEALAKDLPRFMANGGQYANVNVMHSNVTVGRIIPAYKDSTGHTYRTEVDDRGLFVVAEVRTDEAAPQVCQQVIQDILEGRLRSFSISGNAANPTFICDENSCFYHIDDLQLYEITLCEEGVNQEAKLEIINKSKDGERTRLTYMGIPLIKRSRHDELFEATSIAKHDTPTGVEHIHAPDFESDDVDKGQAGEADIGQGEPIQVDEIGYIKSAAQEADIMSYFTLFKGWFMSQHDTGGLDLVLFDHKTGEVLIPDD